ncbi:MAG: GAF domain-containing protein [Bacteroidota bacterium]
MKNWRLSVGTKIAGGFLVLVLIFIANAYLIFTIQNKSDEIVRENSEIVDPSTDRIQEFVLMVTRAKMLFTNWVYLQNSTDDKEALKALNNIEYPQLKTKIKALKESWTDEDQKKNIDSVFTQFDTLLAVGKREIMDQLVSFENYEDAFVKFSAENALESTVLPQTDDIIGKLTTIALDQQNVAEKADIKLIDSSSNLKYTTLILGIFVASIGIILAIVMTRSITKPINYVKNIILKLSQGELVENKNRKFNRDEVGEMARAVDNLVSGLKSTTFFAENIGKGNYDSEFQPLSEQDVLGNALIEMRDNLQKVAEDDRRRNWATEGLAKFGEILRSNNNNIEVLSDDILRNLIKYLNANQGGLYIIESDEGEEASMSLRACYAWNKKKFINQKIYRGEGLAGQVWQEMESVYITDVPDDYISISSGLGDSNPTSVLIVPLKVNEEIYGVVELASFNDFAAHELEFVEKIAESIASTVSTVKINEKTQVLLEESTQMTEQMRAQEEEMRQNMEELQATQEEMQRSQFEALGTVDAINLSFATAEFTTEGELINANENFLNILGYSKDEVMGENHRIFLQDNDKRSNEYMAFWRELANGTPKTGEFLRRAKSGKAVWIRSSYFPIMNNGGDVMKVLQIALDLSEYKEASVEA